MNLLITIVIVGTIIGVFIGASQSFDKITFAIMGAIMGTGVGGLSGLFIMSIYGEEVMQAQTVTYTQQEWIEQNRSVTSSAIDVQPGEPGTVEVVQEYFPGSFWGFESTNTIKVTYFVGE